MARLVGSASRLASQKRVEPFFQARHVGELSRARLGLFLPLQLNKQDHDRWVHGLDALTVMPKDSTHMSLRYSTYKEAPWR
jgi:hypothetical protein